MSLDPKDLRIKPGRLGISRTGRDSAGKVFEKKAQR
jgi:hypothetical protein